VTAVRGVIGKPRIIPRIFKSLHFLQSDTLFGVFATRYNKRSPVAIRPGNPFLYSSFCLKARGSSETSGNTRLKNSVEDKSSSVYKHFCMYRIIVRILISMHVQRLIVQLKFQKLPINMVISKCYRLPQNDLLPTTSSSCHRLEKHWCREVGVGCFTTDPPRCCPPSALPNSTIRTTQPSSLLHGSKPIL
jgi:hypothetical protein